MTALGKVAQYEVGEAGALGGGYRRARRKIVEYSFLILALLVLLIWLAGGDRR